MLAASRVLNIKNQGYVRAPATSSNERRVEKLLMIRGFPVDVATAKIFFARIVSRNWREMRPVREPSCRASLASRA